MKKRIIFLLSLGYFFIAPQVSALELYNPLGDKVTVSVIIGRLISIVVGVVGALALLMFIYGGFLWLTSAGDSKRIESGKSTLIWATLGLVIIFTARAIITLVFSKINP